MDVYMFVDMHMHVCIYLHMQIYTHKKLCLYTDAQTLARKYTEKNCSVSLVTSRHCSKLKSHCQNAS